eukprot:CAMPEP_0119040028 /NCGR_PEP_ID=MMETSP1177-20130426/9826_1 /TAXON_ID=2985 /ORGANISM="Ochromonas sp, Strain CCMP1899" /LENGTH=581 /DNA_ID=CAMNT_0007004675 /DNA_START=74 /DNA_END=1817 /DNA_ORIENTATION=-
MSKILLLLFVSQITTTSAFVRPTCTNNRYASVLHAVGSDILERPEDENTPEFRDYLKNLMKMQANRARSGHSAPSSGSSDAYFAKLSRLKIEREALRRAGLSEDLLDTAYTQADYEAATYEAQEPLVSASILQGDAAVPSREKKSSANKVRSKTSEEIHQEEEADLAVEAALKRQASLPLSERSVVSPSAPGPRPGTSMENTPEMDLIDQVLAGRSLISLKPQQMSSYTDAQKKTIEQLPQKMEELEQIQQLNREVKEAKQVPPPQAREETPPRAPAPVKAVSAVPLRPLPPRETPQMKAPPKAVPAPAPVAVAAAPKSNGRLLQSEEIELAGQTLQLLVKHRGGGPFGAGRLRTLKDVNQLEDLLTKTMGMLCKADMMPGTVSAPAKPTVVAVKEQIPAKVAPPPPVKVVPAPVAKVVQPPLKVAAPVEAVQAAPVSTEDEAPLTIAQGLDTFLQAPNKSSYEELSGLRDGLIQCLYLVQTELGTRPGPSESEDIEQVSSNNDSRAIDRMMKINAPALSSDQEATAVAEIPIEQDVKLALGLLLKHRGGPGFGHGRLVGKELDLMAAKLDLSLNDSWQKW